MSLDQNDNIIVGAGTGGSTQGAVVATDYNSSSENHYQLFKQAFGKDGDFTAVGDGADTGSRPLPVKIFQTNGTPLSAETLTTGLDALNVNLRGTSGSGNVPVDINAQTLGEIRIVGTAGGVPVGVCGDNFQIRTLFGATPGNTLTSIFSHGGDYDMVSVQGVSGAFPVGITATNLHIRPLTSTDQVTVAGTVTVSPGAGFSLDGGTLAIRGGVTGYGHTSLTTSPEGGVPVLLYGNSGGTAAGIGMSGDTLKVSLGQTISADIGDITVDGSAPKASDFDASAKLKDGSQDGTTVGTPVLLYGMSGGNNSEAYALAVTGGGALLTEVQGSISASVGDITVDVPRASGYTHNAFSGLNAGRLLAEGDVAGQTMGQPVLLYGASGSTAVAIGVTLSGVEEALLVHGDMKVHNSDPLSITLGSAQALDVAVKSIPNVTIATVTPTVTVQHAGIGVTIAGGTLAVDNVVQVQGVGFTLSGGSIDSAAVVGGVTGFGTGGFAGGPPSIANAPGTTKGLPVFLYGNSSGTAGAVGMFGDGIKVYHEESINVGTVTGNVTVIGGVTGMAETLHDGPGPVGGGGTLALPVLLYGNSGGTAAGFGMSGDGLKVSVIDGVNLTVETGDVNISDIQVENKTNTLLAVGLSGDTLVPSGATFHDGTALNVNTHFFGLTGGLHNSFGLTAGGTYGSSIMVTGTGGFGSDVAVADSALANIAGGITTNIVGSIWDRDDSNNPKTGKTDESLWDKVGAVKTAIDNLSIPSTSNLVQTAQLNFGGTVPIGGAIRGFGQSFPTDANARTLVLTDGLGFMTHVASVKLPQRNGVVDQTGNTAGLLPSEIHATTETAVRLPSHILEKGVTIKNTSGTGILHVGFINSSSPFLPDSAALVIGSSYRLASFEEVFIETSRLDNLWVASCPGASGCYIGG